MELNDILYLIKNSNLENTTKSFLNSVLKDLKSEEDTAWAQRAAQIDAKKQLDEDRAYERVESPDYRKTYPDKYEGKIGRMTPDPEAVRPADQSDVDYLTRINQMREANWERYGKGKPMPSKLDFGIESEKSQFNNQADNLFKNEYGLGYEGDYIERFDGDPKFADPEEEIGNFSQWQAFDDPTEQELVDEDFNNLLDDIADGY